MQHGRGVAPAVFLDKNGRVAALPACADANPVTGVLEGIVDHAVEDAADQLTIEEAQQVLFAIHFQFDTLEGQQAFIFQAAFLQQFTDVLFGNVQGVMIALDAVQGQDLDEITVESLALVAQLAEHLL